jgi:hypothetical protein
MHINSSFSVGWTRSRHQSNLSDFNHYTQKLLIGRYRTHYLKLVGIIFCLRFRSPLILPRTGLTSGAEIMKLHLRSESMLFPCILLCDWILFQRGPRRTVCGYGRKDYGPGTNQRRRGHPSVETTGIYTDIIRPRRENKLRRFEDRGGLCSKWRGKEAATPEGRRTWQHVERTRGLPDLRFALCAVQAVAMHCESASHLKRRTVRTKSKPLM